jgi:hypothetical protein
MAKERTLKIDIEIEVESLDVAMAANGPKSRIDTFVAVQPEGTARVKYSFSEGSYCSFGAEIHLVVATPAQAAQRMTAVDNATDSWSNLKRRNYTYREQGI